MDNRDESIIKMLILYEQQMDSFLVYLVIKIENFDQIHFHLPISMTSLNIVCSSRIADCTLSSIPTKNIVCI